MDEKPIDDGLYMHIEPFRMSRNCQFIIVNVLRVITMNVSPFLGLTGDDNGFSINHEFYLRVQTKNNASLYSHAVLMSVLGPKCGSVIITRIKLNRDSHPSLSPA